MTYFIFLSLVSLRAAPSHSRQGSIGGKPNHPSRHNQFRTLITPHMPPRRRLGKVVYNQQQQQQQQPLAAEILQLCRLHLAHPGTLAASAHDAGCVRGPIHSPFREGKGEERRGGGAGERGGCIFVHMRCSGPADWDWN